MAARGQSLLPVAAKVTKSACPAARCFLRCSQRAGCVGRHTKTSLTLRKVCVDDASTTARCSAPRRGLKEHFVRHQLCGESQASYGYRPIYAQLSTLCFFTGLARIKWAFQEKAACNPEYASLLPGHRDVYSSGITFGYAKLRNPDASVRAGASE